MTYWDIILNLCCFFLGAGAMGMAWYYWWDWKKYGEMQRHEQDLADWEEDQRI
jgi:hypothetical protein